MDDAQLRTVWQQRQFNDRVVPLGQPLAIFMKHTLGKLHKQIGQIAGIWDELVPSNIADHTALDGLRGGTLTVIVDSAPHRFQLRQLLDGGLLAELRARYRGALNKVRLVPGQLCTTDDAGNKRYVV